MDIAVTDADRAKYQVAHNRESVPCASDAHVFRSEVYEDAADATWIEQERCTICGWSWGDIADHDQGECCCPGDHRSPRLERS